jgi:hypothetical protein
VYSTGKLLFYSAHSVQHLQAPLLQCIQCTASASSSSTVHTKTSPQPTASQRRAESQLARLGEELRMAKEELAKERRAREEERRASQQKAEVV